MPLTHTPLTHIHQVVVYARAGVHAQQLLRDAEARFNIRLDKPIEVRV